MTLDLHVDASANEHLDHVDADANHPSPESLVVPVPKLGFRIMQKDDHVTLRAAGARLADVQSML